MEKNAIYDKMDEKIKELVNDASISHEIKGQVLAEFAVQTATQFNAQASSDALKVIQVSAENVVQEMKNKLTTRQIQGYDDNMLIKNTEFQSGVTGFAVNSNSDSAQGAINDLKAKMDEVQKRVLPLEGEPTCPTPTPVTPVPTGLIATTITDTSITIEWNAIVDGTSYEVYQDGIRVATGNSLNYTADGLNQLTKYSFSIRASKNGILSNFTPAIVPQTIATP